MKDSRSCPGLADGSSILADSGWWWVPARREGWKEVELYHEREGLKAESLGRRNWQWYQEFGLTAELALGWAQRVPSVRVADVKEARQPIMRA